MNNFQSIFEGVSAPIIVWDTTGNIVASNRAATTCLGYSADELARMHLTSVEAQKGKEDFSERLAQLQAGGLLDYTTVLRHKDIGTIDMAARTSTIVWDDTEAYCTLYHRPLFDDKDEKTAPGDSEARFRAITDATKDAIIMMDETGHVTLWNPAAEKIFGYTSPEIIGKNLHMLLAPSRYHHLHQEAFIKFQQTGVGNAINRTLELNACHKDGYEIAIELSLSRLPVTGSWHALGIIRDITERKRAEKELRDSEERFRVLHDASFGGIAIHDQGAILDCNQGLVDITGYTRDELLGMDGRLLVAPDWRAIVMENIRTRYAEPYDVEGLKKDGTTYPLSVRGGNIPYRGREVRVTEFRDITERRQADKERKRLEEQLMQAQKMEAIGRLAGGVAHDFNNILSAILGNVDLARNMVSTGSPATKLLDKALAAIHRATQLINQILAFSRQKDAQRLPLHVLPIITEVVKLLRPLLPSTITITEHVEKDVLPILADPTQVHQVLMNLCTNAFHVMELTGGDIAITLENVEVAPAELNLHPGVKAGRYVKLSVGDTGPGIPPGVEEKIFDPYFTTKTVGKGTGMGLSIVHGIVKSSDGFITVDTEVGKGACFQVYFPAVESMEGQEEVEEYAVERGSERILLVDDEEIVADMERSILEYLGYDVTLYTDSVEALGVFQQAPSMFDVVITDQTMPVMTGFDLAQRILAIRPEIPIIICTGYSRTLSKEKALAMGVQGFAMKPMAMRDISQVIRQVLDSQSEER